MAMAMAMAMAMVMVMAMAVTDLLPKRELWLFQIGTTVRSTYV